MAVVLTSRTDDSAIDMELSHLSDVPEEGPEHQQEKETLMGEIEIEMPVPKELDMPHTPRMPMKTFADLRDPPTSTSTPAPVKSSTDFKIRRPSKRKSVNGPTENSNSPDDGIVLEDTSNISKEDVNPCDECEPVQPKSRGQFGLLLASVGLSILIGFLIGYYVRGEKYRIENENEVCVIEQIPTSLTAQQLQYQDQAVSGTSKDRLQQFTRTLAQSQCMSGTPCSYNLTNRLVTKFKNLGLPNVEVSTYNVLVSHPVMTRPSKLRTIDAEGSVLETFLLYGDEEVTSSSNSTVDKPSSGNTNSSPDGLNKRSIADTPLPPVPMYMPYSASGTAQGELLYVNCASMNDFAAIQEMGIDVTGRMAISRQCDMMTMEQIKNVEDNGMVGLILYTDPADSVQPMGMTGMYGDPLTPGCPASDGIYRTNKSEVLPVIPVQTVSTDVAEMLLGNITGKVAHDDWHGGLNITYKIGRKSNKPSWTVELDVHNTMEQQDIHNIMATIPGTDYPDQYVMIGGHYTGIPTDDTTTATGSTSMMLEVATGLADLLEDGWQPKRTVMLGLWEGAEMGSSGSTEWVEEHRMVVGDRTVAYIDLDSSVGDAGMVIAETSPVLKGIVMDAAEQLDLTDDVITTSLDGMGDHVPFSHELGVPSVSFHTSMDKFLSTTMLATKTLLLLADDPIIQYDGLSLAEMVSGYVDNLGTMMEGNNATMASLDTAVNQYMQEMLTFEAMVDDLGSMADPVTMSRINQRLMYMEKAFVMDGSSDMMRNILYGTQQMETFPVMIDAMSDEKTTESVEEMLSAVQCVLQSATTSLSLS
ncbi:glutamate carboxypeptidase 2-like [Amphiura filiformis]|uniref:glutamate carboxypeptidase 2-like n=1 Tax=Amphiura filiformis TaxID=82378 RepID=UPI003B2204C5